MLEENNFKRMCSFYVSNIHLSTMILPYLSEKLEKGEILTTFLEKDIQEEMEILLSKTNIRESLKNTINNINWNKTKQIKYSEIKNYINKYKGKNRINILVVGTNEYIANVNKNIQMYMVKNNNISINEIDAYEVKNNRKDLSDILNNYDYMLNTSGEHLVKDVFGIQKNNKVERKEIV